MKQTKEPDLNQLEQLKKWFVRAVALTDGGAIDKAAELYRNCLVVMPELHDARLNLAYCLGAMDDFEAARRELTTILCDQPGNDKARTLLGQALLRLGRGEEALEQFMLLHSSAPADSSLTGRIAETLYSLQRYEEAREWIERSLMLQPDRYESLQTLAAIERTENPERALSLYRRLAQEQPDDHRTRLFHATLLLSLGLFSEGWPEFEQRIPTLEMSADILSIPRWHGQPLHGKSIVLVAEQGHGDALQFIRYATVMAERGARVMVLCQNDQIRPVLQCVAGVEAVVIPKEPLPFMPDYHCPLMSLPFELGTTLENIPVLPGYLHADPGKVAAWRQRITPLPGLKIGLVWGGNRAQADNAKRSVPFDMLGYHLREITGITFVSLQVGPDALKHQPDKSSLPLIDWTDELRDFGDTAALAVNLDLVISICSGVTHLCGGLGVPTWVMLQYDADWRWLRNRNDSPWYPGMKLFRQTKPGAWAELLLQMRQALTELACCPPPSAGTAFTDESATKPATQNSSTGADDCYRSGVAAWNAGNLPLAETDFRRGIALDNSHCDLLNGLATVLDQLGKTEEAIVLYRRALAAMPDAPIVMFNLANSLRKTGEVTEAEQLYRKAMAVNPQFYAAHAGLGNLLLNQMRGDEAEEPLLRSLKLNSAQPDLLCDLGALAGERGDTILAEERLRQALQLDPDHPAALNQLGMLLMWQNRLDEAELLLRRAIDSKPGYVLAMNNLGVLLHWAGRFDEAEAVHRAMIAAQPDNATARFNLSLVLLSEGKFIEGWREYESRFLKDNPVPVRHGAIPRWHGEDIAGRRILVHAEQGYGDTIQFARYLPVLAKRGCLIVLECQDRVIAPLFEGMTCLTALLSRGDALPPVDLQIPLMSLPLMLGVEADHEPVSVNYLTPHPQRLHDWRERLAALPGLKVGVVWSGRRGQDNNHNRMIAPQVFARLAGINGISYVNLLVGINDHDADAVLTPLGMFDARPFLKDFADTAALLASLDLLVSVDTATTHLAGALGVDTRVMIPYNADWRWTFGFPACQLYPLVTIYRQEKPFAWEPVIDAVRNDLERLCQQEEISPIELMQKARTAREEFRWEDALAAYLHVQEKEQLNCEALSGVGACLQMLNRNKDALAWYDEVLKIFPEDVALHCNRALVLLTLGRYPEGWRELQWRKRMLTAPLPPFPALTPELIRIVNGKTVLLHVEQGFGDTIQMIRYVPLLAKLGARVYVTVPPELVRLVSYVSGVSRVISHGDPLPLADFQAMMMDLPWLFGTTVETIPLEIPYIKAPQEEIVRWQERLGAKGTRKVGLVWACGGENQLNRRMRSLTFAQLEELVNGNRQIDFYSLQFGPDALNNEELARHPNLYDLTGGISDFADTAALIMCLDHVITVDSAVAHLAGALGKPVTLLLPSFREWRWGERNGNVLWYPTVQIRNKL